MDVGIIVIGDEILNGYRQDRHLPRSIELLSARGHRLVWCQIIGDNRPRIVTALKAARAENIPVFCFGGIGATPDDHTRQCAAAAFDLPLSLHPEAAAILQELFGEGAYPKRILMAELPQGASLIPNPVNRVPGFSVGDMHFLPGFPQMAGPMMEWVLNHYPDNLDANRVRKVMRVFNGHESEFIDVMNDIGALGAEISISSLPVIGKEQNYIDFVVTGETDLVSRAEAMLIRCAQQQQAEFSLL